MADVETSPVVVQNRKSPQIASGNPKEERQWDIYFRLFLKYESEYKAKNRKFALLYQIGDFYEIYGVENGVETIGNTREICQIMNIKISQKNSKEFNPNKDPAKNDRDHPLFAGYQVNSRVVFEPILAAAGFDVIVYSQTGRELEDGTKERCLEKIITPATNIENNTLSSENLSFVSVYIENLMPPNTKLYQWENGMFSVGITSLDLSTNKTTVCEAHSKLDDKMYSINELYRFLQSESPKELMITVGENIDLTQTIEDVTFEDFLRKTIGFHLFQNVHSIANIDPKFKKVSYQEEFLLRIYHDKCKMTDVFGWLGLELKNHSTLSLLQLLEFVNSHDPRLLKKLNKPKCWTSNKYLVLSKNAVEQLQICLPTGDQSLFKIINKTHTNMGARLLKSHITSPVLSVDELQRRWYFVEIFSKDNRYKEIAKFLKDIHDLSRNYRLLQINRLPPYALLNIHSSHKSVLKMLKYFVEKSWIDETKLFEGRKCFNVDDLKNIIAYVERTFVLENISMSSGEMKISYFKKGLYSEIDELQGKIEKSKCSLANFRKFVDSLMGIDDVLKILNVKKGTDIIHNKNRPISFKLTLKRFELIEHYIKAIQTKDNNKIWRYQSFSEFTKRNNYASDEGEGENSDENETENVNNPCASYLTQEDVKFLKSICKVTKPSSGSTTKDVSFQSDIISSVSEERNDYETEMIALNAEKFSIHMNVIDKMFENLISSLPELVAYIDVMTSHAECAISYAYNKPTVGNADSSYIKALQLRHPIIERIHLRVPYIPNNVDIGTPENKGLLIYGCNDAGKSSYMRSVGLNLVLAQIGSFVAAKEFEFVPFRNILTRLSGQDNVYKGEGSFRVEMNEFRDICCSCDQYSLVLGDELARGSEIHSAVSLVAAGIMYLTAKQTNFIFTTHLHQLPDISEVNSIATLKFKHLQVKRDPVTNVITYIRTLADGSGDSIYGIDVARGSSIAEEILVNAEKIRKKLLGQSAEVLENKASHFNARLWKSECVVCGKPSTEVHHIREQNEADENGIIEHFHKNSEFNLCYVCHECHETKLHRQQSVKLSGYVMTSDGRKLKTNQ